MKRKTLIAVLLVIAISAGLVSTLQAQSRKSSKSLKRAVLTTADTVGSGKILGIVSVKGGSSKPADVIKSLYKEAAKLKADRVVAVRLVSHAGYLIAYGTAIADE